jgi:hypothetical protein
MFTTQILPLQNAMVSPGFLQQIKALFVVASFLSPSKTEMLFVVVLLGYKIHNQKRTPHFIALDRWLMEFLLPFQSRCAFQG